MFCSKCGTQLPDGAQFCYQCGNSIAVPSAAAPAAHAKPMYEMPAEPSYSDYAAHAAHAAPEEPTFPQEPVFPQEPTFPQEPVYTPPMNTAPFYAAPTQPAYHAAPVESAYHTMPMYEPPLEPAFATKSTQDPSVEMALPTYQPPMYQPAIFHQPAYQQPGFPPSAYNQPTYPPTSYDTPGYPTYPSASYDAPGYPAYSQMTYQQPAYEQPGYQASYSSYSSSSYDQPTYSSYDSSERKKPSSLLIALIAFCASLAVIAGALYFSGALNGFSSKGNNKGGSTRTTGAGRTTTTTTVTGGSTTLGGDSTGSTTLGSGSTTLPSGSTTGTAVIPPSTEYNTGYLQNNVYYNHWANLQYSIEPNWQNGTDEEYASYENSVTECGLYVKYSALSAFDVVAVFYERLQGNDANMAVGDYAQFYCDNIQSQYVALGYTCSVSDLSTVRMAGETWHSFSIALGNNSGSYFRRYMMRKVDNYIVFVEITTTEQANLTSLTFNFASIR